MSDLPQQLRQQAGWDNANASALLSAAREIEQYQAALRVVEAERDALREALLELVTSFAEADEEGLIEHAEPMQKARAALEKCAHPNELSKGTT